jgi:ABC-type transport system involved in cytochrome c biogenesis permease subunit
MKRLALAAILALVLVAAAPATAAGPTLRSLQAQITSLKKQVKKLQKQVKDNQTLAVAGLAYGACTSAVTADAFQGTWTALDGRFVSEGHTALFGAQTPVNDFNFCQGFSVVRARNQNPPTVGVFQALLNIFK